MPLLWRDDGAGSFEETPEILRRRSPPGGALAVPATGRSVRRGRRSGRTAAPRRPPATAAPSPPASPLAAALPGEIVAVSDARGRVLAAPIHARTPVPAFDTAAMDGYAVAGSGPWTITRQIAGRPATPLPVVAVTGSAALMKGGVRIVPVRHHGEAARIVAVKGSAGLRAAAVADALAVLPGDWADDRPAALLTIP
ncbi:hypothetical protein [Actinoplanes sp. NPDC023714]|uniref:hypothetical protein n=1 Tax=Actinoplanes sp. NPDC023714 TaxID=3154322 RepID=UPI00340C79A0